MNQDKQGKTRRNIIFSVSTVVFAALVLFFYVISNLPAVSAWFDGIFSVLAPVIGGAALAYLCNPILKFFEKYPLRRIRSLYAKRMLGIFFTYLFFILIIAAIGLLIIPQLINSVKALVAQYENYIANAVTNLNQLISNILQNFPIDTPEGTVQEFVSLDKINALLETLVGSVGDLFNVLLENIQSYGAKLFSTISNVILALFISFYLLASKEKRVAQIKKLTTALFNEKQNKFIYETASLANNAFGGFLGGKLLDALIIGIVYFIIFSIFGIPYAPMLATIMGVMNIIPFFGPIIGAIPSAFIVLISAPEKIFIFIILVLIVGQIDGNIIEPKVLGDRTGVSSLCVIIAISVMGNLWGIFGMIIGVPLFAVVIALVEQFANARLGQKGLSDDLDDYYNDDEDSYGDMEDGTKVRLSKRYYVAKVAYVFTPKSKRGAPPCRDDYMIYPPEYAPEPSYNTFDETLDDETRETLEEQNMLEGYSDLPESENASDELTADDVDDAQGEVLEDSSVANEESDVYMDIEVDETVSFGATEACDEASDLKDEASTHATGEADEDISAQ